MVLTELSVRNFRSYNEAKFVFDDHINVIIGPNGIGKTNLLEAIYVAMQGVSFRVSDKELPGYGQDWFRIDAAFDTQTRSLTYRPQASPPKQLSVNDGAKKRFMRTQRLPVVLFEPDMLRVLSGSPARRRQLLDGLIIQWFDDGQTLLRKYERVLMQRNAILKDAYSLSDSQLEDKLFVWDVSFAELASRIEQHRHKIVAIINEKISSVYSSIAQKDQHVNMVYHPAAQHSKQTILQQLHAHRRLDIARGFTTVGPHRSDFLIELNQKPSETTASRGEQRSLVLAIKYIETKELEQLAGTAPIVLLDDVMSELDSKRQDALLSGIGVSQIVVTTTDVSLWRHISGKTITL